MEKFSSSPWARHDGHVAVQRLARLRHGAAPPIFACSCDRVLHHAHGPRPLKLDREGKVRR